MSSFHRDAVTVGTSEWTHVHDHESWYVHGM